MYDPTFHSRTLARELRVSDFAPDKPLSQPGALEDVIASAVLTAAKGFEDLQIEISEAKSKSVCQLVHLSDELILRLISRNIRRITGVKQSNRENIIRSLRAILGEGLDFRVYKIDIRNFYETVSIDSLLNKLTLDSAFPRDSVRILTSFFQSMKQKNISGLPRGIALSATLSEYVMRQFDRVARAASGVYFYSRFVDDIFVLTAGDENPAKFLKFLRRHLFDGLSINYDKTRYINFFNKPSKDPAVLAGKFDFLGYEFTVFKRYKEDRQVLRRVSLDVAPRKINRIKTRIFRSFRTYVADKNFSNLKDRLKVLSGNYNLYDRTKHIRRDAGFYCNYRLVNAAESNGITELDKFLKSMLLAKNSDLSKELSNTLTSQQKRDLLRISFRKSFVDRTFYHYPPNRLSELMGCWAYV